MKQKKTKSKKSNRFCSLKHISTRYEGQQLL